MPTALLIIAGLIPGFGLGFVAAYWVMLKYKANYMTRFRLAVCMFAMFVCGCSVALGIASIIDGRSGLVFFFVALSNLLFPVMTFTSFKPQ